MLDPGGPVRSGSGYKEVSLSSNPAGFELPLIAETSYASYEATLVSEGNVIRTWPGLKPARSQVGKVIRISMPTGLSPASQPYHFVLNGVTSSGEVKHVEDYYFRLTN